MKALVLGLYSVTPVHPGSGSEISVIDLPIQRERHTGFPVIWGQSLKGVLRVSYSGKYKEEIFGPDTNNASDHAGAIAVGDSRVLLFPVRSIRGVFAYVTCPLVLRRFVEDLKRAKILNDGEELKIKVNEGAAKIAVDKKDHLNVVDNTIVLEDIPLTVEGTVTLNTVLDKIKELLPQSVREDFKNRLVIVSDDLFTMLVKTTTEIVTRIKIDPKTGTVDKERGALWYEEFLPGDTLMYSVILVNDSRKKDSTVNAGTLARELRDSFNGKFLQVGGDETVGKGFVKVSVLEGGE